MGFSESRGGPRQLSAGPVTAHPRPRAVLLWQDQGVLPSGPGGGAGEAAGREAARRRGDHPELGAGLAGTPPLPTPPLGHAHPAEIRPRRPGQTVREGRGGEAVRQAVGDPHCMLFSMLCFLGML